MNNYSGINEYYVVVKLLLADHTEYEIQKFLQSTLNIQSRTNGIAETQIVSDAQRQCSVRNSNVPPVASHIV